MNYKIIDREKLDKVADMVVVNVRHDFTEEELNQHAQILAQAVNDKSHEEDQKKMVMAEFKAKIDTQQSKINQYAGYLTNKFMYVDKPAEMYRDYARAKRVYFDKATGDFLSEETFHASDYQKKIEFDEREEDMLQEDIARQQQIEENNKAGNHAEGTDQLDEVIIDKKLGKDRNGNLTDIKKDIVEPPDDELPDDENLFKDIK